ncbi:MAG: TM1812 family CRISPR-associated protein [Ruminococcus sp.]|nr:TM1812 family CRISPR-associated protein [Ruminococcus sp.]
MKNILITIISPWDENKKLCKYNAHEYGEVEASLASEACCKYVIEKLKSENKKLDNAICLVSTQAETGYDHFRDEFSNIQVEDCKISDECIENNEYSEPLDDVVTRVKEIAKDDKKIVIHFDLAGGLRNISVLIEQLTRFFKHYGYEIESYYTYYVNTDQSKNTFFDCKNLYKQIDILDGVNEFVTRGSAKKLQECYENVNDEDVKKLLDCMGEFNDEIELCRVDNLNETLNGMNNALECLKKNKSNGENVFLLRQMIPLIEKKFYGGEKIDYLSTIRWCLDNGLIQQALTIYVEKVPEYLFEKKKVLEMTEDNFVDANNKKGAWSLDNTYADCLYKEILEHYSTELFKEMKAAIKECFYEDKKIVLCKSGNIKNMKNSEVKKFIDDLAKIQTKNNPRKINMPNRYYAPELYKKVNRVARDKNSNTSFERLIELLLNDDKYLKKWMDLNETYSRKIYNTKHINAEDMPKGVKLYTDVASIQACFYDYIYVKAIRNHTNHAADDGRLSKKVTDFFDSKGYTNINKITPESVRKDMNNILDRIEKLKVKKPVLC